jgi:hypothetical protein
MEMSSTHPRKLEKKCTKLMAYTCNPSYLGGWDWEDHGSKPAQAKKFWDPISREKARHGGMYLSSQWWEA